MHRQLYDGADQTKLETVVYDLGGGRRMLTRDCNLSEEYRVEWPFFMFSKTTEITTSLRNIGPQQAPPGMHMLQIAGCRQVVIVGRQDAETVTAKSLTALAYAI